MSAQTRVPTVGLLIIGDEILNGSVEERNAGFFITRLRELGAKLERIVFLPDQKEEIAATVRQFSQAYDHVFTSGGIGPTHDDVTLEAVAMGLNRPLHQDPDLLARIQEVTQKDFGPGYARLSRVPEGSELVQSASLRWPLIKVENIWVFPGVPGLLRDKFNAVASNFKGPGWYRGAVELHAREAVIATDLDRLVQQFPSVAIGSYPRREDNGWHVKLTVEASTREGAVEALEAMATVFKGHLTGQHPITFSGSEDS